MRQSRLFLVFEGGEGSGKSTQAKLLARYLESCGYPVLLTKEPGGNDELCGEIRKILLDPRHAGQINRETEFMLFEADRAQHVQRVIDPALADGKIVICDRYEASTYAYQCGGRNVCGSRDFELINGLATQGLRPDFTFWLDIDPEIGLRRNVEAKKRDRLEMEAVDFHQHVRNGYEYYFHNMVESEHWMKFDAQQSIEAIHSQIISVLRKLVPN